jgi:hypothetical protein
MTKNKLSTKSEELFYQTAIGNNYLQEKMLKNEYIIQQNTQIILFYLGVK